MTPATTRTPSFYLRAKPGTRRRSLISLTPLIDVVFILLIFFMLATSFLDWRAITLNAPARAGSGQSIEGALLIRMNTHGGLELNGSILSDTALEQRVASRLESHPEQRILIQPAEGVPLQRAVRLLDRLTAAGGQDIAFMPGANARSSQ